MQLQAGYQLSAVNRCLRKWYENAPEKELQVKGLLRWLTTFDVVSTMDLARADTVNPIFAVAQNILTRGLPTLPSVYIEESLAAGIGATQRVDNPNSGSIHFTLSESEIDGDALFNALHPVVPGQERPIEFYDTQDTDSSFERDFIFNYCARQPVVAQLLQKQRELTTVAQGFIHGRVDFSLEIPYYESHARQNRYTKSTELKNTRALIVEVDGAHYHEQIIDDARDFATAEMGNNTSRITEGRPVADAASFLEMLLSEAFVENTSVNFSQPDFATSIAARLVLEPLAIARVQRAILEYLLSAKWASQEKDQLQIAILDRDMAGGELAVRDLQKTLAHLSAMAESDQWQIPELVYTQLTVEDLSNVRELDRFDLVIDNAVLRRSGIFTEDRRLSDRPNVLQLRTAHFVASSTHTPVVSAQPIIYQPVVLEKENERYDDIPEAVTLVRKFLQDIFRKRDFRLGQLPILNRAFQRKSVIGLLPTGGGKSLTYQLAALLQPGATLVVDPIRALMMDQVRSLSDILIDKAAFINSTLTTGERRYAQDELLKNGRLQFVFVSPERFVIQGFRDALSDSGNRGHFFTHVVIDEAHCVSEWGHDFRTPYLDLGLNAQDFTPTWDKNEVPLFGLTATASFDVLADIERELQIKDDDGKAVVRFENTVRDEVNYQIRHVKAEIPEAAVFDKFNVKEFVAKPKQAEVFRILATKQQTLAPYNDYATIRRVAGHSFTSYLSSAERKKQEAAATDGRDATEWYQGKMAKQILFSDQEQPFSQNEDRYGYGIVVFTPHRTGWLGIKNGSNSSGLFENSDFVTLPENANGLTTEYQTDLLGYFMGSSEEKEQIANLIDEQSFANMDLFTRNQISVMVATKAFGMGIDKNNIRLTIHMNPPSSIESYVQEAGRAGRDRKTALSIVLFNDETFPVEGRPYHQDFEVLDFFHQRSFKGQMKERTMLYELRNEVTYPHVRRKRDICERLAVEYPGFSGWSLNYWSKNYPQGNRARLYVNVDQVEGNNYIDLLNGGCHSDDLPIEILYDVKERISDGLTEGYEKLKDWLNGWVIPEGLTTGIERRFRTMSVGEQGEVVVFFTNRYYSKPTRAIADFRLNENHLELLDGQDIWNEIPALQEKEHLLEDLLSTAVRENYPFEKFLKELGLKEPLRKELEEANSGSAQKFQRAYYADRGKADTDKAIYRLSSIGIIDTYTIDYQNNLYRLSFKRLPDDEYFSKLENFVARYSSRARAKQMIDNLRKQSAPDIAAGKATAISVCLDFLTTYIYDNIRLKRERAIEDMIGLCRNALEIKDSYEHNKFIKDEIYFYFNAKYSRKGYKESINGEEKPASLLDDDLDNQMNSQKIINKYLSLIENAETGEFINNCKHLRGSTMRLLRARPNEPHLMVLKSFSLFVLGAKLPNLRQEAVEELLNGLIAWKKIESDLSVVTFLQSFEARLQKHIYDYDISELMQSTLVEFELTYYSQWLVDFNQKFIGNYGEGTDQQLAGEATPGTGSAGSGY